jgi:DNA gyrase/topoisomerase IV subunit A
VEIINLAVSSCTLAGFVAWLILFRLSETKKKAARDAECKEVQDYLAGIRQDFQACRKNVEAGLKNYAKDSLEVKAEMKTGFQSYFDTVDSTLKIYAADSSKLKAGLQEDFKLYGDKLKNIAQTYSDDSLKLKSEIQTELQRILHEIKEPLDLD